MTDEPCTTCQKTDCPGAPRFKGLCALKAPAWKKLEEERAVYFNQFLQMRNVETPCTTCRGFGVRSYASTSTWRGGMGGSMITSDVCDSCWGSGDVNYPWVNLKVLRNAEDKRVELRAATLLEDACGAGLRTLLPGMTELASRLEKFAAGRGRVPEGFNIVSGQLAKALRKMVVAKEEDMVREKAEAAARNKR